MSNLTLQKARNQLFHFYQTVTELQILLVLTDMFSKFEEEEKHMHSHCIAYIMNQFMAMTGCRR